MYIILDFRLCQIINLQFNHLYVLEQRTNCGFFLSEIKEISFFTNTKKWSEINEGTLKISISAWCSTPTPKKTC